MNDTVIALINNMILLFATSILCVVLPIKYLVYNNKITPARVLIQIIGGIVIGLIGVGTMLNPITLMEGLFFDVRSILISTASLVFGPIPSITAALIVGGFRLFQGGVGMVPGSLQVLLTALLGMLWRHIRLKKIILNKRTRWVELYLFGFIAHILVLSTFFILPAEAAAKSWQSVSIPIIVAFPIGVVLLGTVLLSQTDNYNTRTKLEESEGRLKTMLMSVGVGVIAADDKGQVTLINKAAQDVLGHESSQVLGKPVSDFYNIFSRTTNKALQNPVDRVLSTGVISGLTSDTALLRKDGGIIPISENAAPIMSLDGEMTGAILVFRDATEESRHLDRINYLAFHDVLTGLYNRSFFDEESKRLDVERNLPISVIIGDVNGLKLTNDAFGHDVGDMLLKEMGEAIKQVCRKDDIVARWGGDEFIIFLPKTDAASVEIISSRIKESCSKVKISNIKFSISIGYDTKTSAEMTMRELIKSAEDYMYRKKTTDSSSIRGNTITTILQTLHEKNTREQKHSHRVSELCKKIAEAMNLSEKEINELELAGLMHDIGKIAISDNLLNKEGRLNPSEFAKIERHPEIGCRILSTSSSMSYIAQYVLGHHERPDGKGYPFGFTKEQIPLQSRIIAVADTFDAMTSQRTYRKPVSKEEAIEEMLRCRGSQLDEDIVNIFVEKVMNKNIDLKELDVDINL